MSLIFLIQILKIKENLGEYSNLPVIKCEDITNLLKKNNHSLVIFENEEFSFNFMNFGINQFKNQINFIKTHYEENCSIKCFEQPCFLPFYQTEELNIGKIPLVASEFSNWLRLLINPFEMKITKSEELQYLFQLNKNLIFLVDLEEIPNNIPKNMTIYKVTSSIFAALNFSIGQGIFLYRYIDRELIQIEDNYEILINSSIKNLKYLNINSKQFLAGFVSKEDNDNFNEVAYYTLNELNKQFNSKINFVPFIGSESQKYIEIGNLQSFEEPIFVVFNTNEIEKGRWLLTGDGFKLTNLTILTEFLEEIISGKKKYTIISKELPEQNESIIFKEINAENFDEMVKNENYDVLVAFTAPWCHHCNTFKPILKAASQVLINNNIKIYFIDATSNDIPKYVPEIQGFPTLYLWPRDSKNQIIEFDEDRNVPSIISFFLKNTKYPFEIPEYNLEEIENQIKLENENE